jgi:hypothetical protein
MAIAGALQMGNQVRHRFNGCRAGPVAWDGPLALGSSSDVYVVFFKITQNPAAAAMAALLSLLLLLVLWYALPLWLRLVKNGDSERVPRGRQ